MEFDELSKRVIGCALEVHKTLGPGLLESAYEKCLAYELAQAKIPFSQQVAVQVKYKGVEIDCGYRADIVVEGKVLVELKSVEQTLPIHEAQLLTYMKLAKLPIGLLINFNVKQLKNGLKRMVL